MSFVLIIEPKKAPYLQATNNAHEIIREKVGMVRDQMQTGPDVVMVMDDHACMPREELEQIGKELPYNFSWVSPNPNKHNLDFSGNVVIVDPDGDGFEEDRAREIKLIFEKITGRKDEKNG